MSQRKVIIALSVAVLLVIARSAVFLIWEQSGFDADQAIFGLMAKHIVEGRAVPLFIYGDRYMLAVQAWLAVPLFAMFGPSVPLLKLPVLAVNVATAILLVRVLIRDAGLRPMMALTASLFFAAAPPVMAKLLVETGGGNPEPFLYVLLLWTLRHRPIAFGVLLAIGFMHREFTAYGATALIAIALLADWRITIERLRYVALAGAAFLVVSQAIQAAFVWSTPFGPGTTIDPVSHGVAGAAALTSRYCWAPDSIAPSLKNLFGDFLGVPFGATDHRMVDFGVRSVLPAGLPGVAAFWPVLGSIFAVALIRVLWIAVRERRPIWLGAGAVGTFLLLVGLQSGVAYALARCGRLEPTTFRYALLTLYIGVGVATLYFVYERQRAWRGAMAAVVLACSAISAGSHVRLLNEYINHEPANPHRALADYLLAHQVRYARADYWTTYATTFHARELVVIASTDTVRISSYQRDVASNSSEAVDVQRQPCAAGGVEAVAGTYWICAGRNRVLP